MSIKLVLAATLLVSLPGQSQPSDSRTALIQSLNSQAARQTAARRAEIASIHTRAQAEARQRKVRATMLRLIGPLPERTPLNPQVLGETSAPGVKIQKILFDSQPGFHVTALLYLPEVPTSKPLAAIVMAPGHGATGKASDFAFAAAFARNGFAVLSYDPIGQGERLQYPDPTDPTDPTKSLATRPTGEHGEASLQPILLGETLAKYMLWDGMRAVDYLQSRPEIDPKRIGAFGCSGGGAMTALLGALDARIAATGTACYITSFDTLLPSIGPQDGEQSTPGWIANGLDFPDWVELAAPRPYAIIATESDMFPFAGAQSTEAESRSFYKLWSADQNLSFIHGPGGHGNLRPIQPEILAFFQQHLQVPANPETPGAPSLTASPSRVGSTTSKPEQPSAGATKVTPTGQVSTSFPNSETVFSLNLKHAATIQTPHPATITALATSIRAATHEHSTPGTYIGADALVCCSHSLPSKVTKIDLDSSLPPEMRGGSVYLQKLTFRTGDGATFDALLAGLEDKASHPGSLLVADLADPALLPHMLELAKQGNVVLAVTPRPSPAGSEEIKSPILGPFYLLGLRADLVGQTLLGMRTDDVVRATDYLAALLATYPGKSAPITAEADGHMALVLLHAAIFDPRLTHITLTHLPPSYRDVLAEPLPKDLPQDIVPGVLLHYDLPDLLQALSSRCSVS